MSAHCLTGRLLVHREIACSVAAAQPTKKYPILLAKSLQGDKIKLYYIVWLSEIGLLSYHCPDWRHDASRFSRMSSAPSNSPAVSGGFWDSSLALDDRRSGSRQPRDGIDWRKMSQHCLTPVGRLLTYRESGRAWSRLTTVRRRSSLSSADGGRPGMSVGTRGAVADDPGAVAIP